MSEGMKDQPPEIEKKLIVSAYENLPTELIQKAEGDFTHLKALRWLSSEPGDTVVYGRTYEQARVILKQLDMDELRDLSSELARIFQDQYAGKAYTSEQANQLEQDTLQYANELAVQHKARQANSREFDFGKGQTAPDDQLRIYLMPRLDKVSLQTATRQVFEMCADLDCHLKIYSQDWFQKTKSTSGEWCWPSASTNRFVLYVDRKSPSANALMQAIANNMELRNLCEDSGEWMHNFRVPLSSGVSIVEGTIKSWDTDAAPTLKRYLHLIKTGEWLGPDGVPIPLDAGPDKISPLERKHIETVLQNRTLESIGRVTSMPGMRNN